MRAGGARSRVDEPRAMAPAARPHGITTPQPRSILLFQDQLSRGLYKQRHLEALIRDERAAPILYSVLECTKELGAGRRQAGDNRAALQKVGQKNMFCLCRNLCPDETKAWATCVRDAARALRQGKASPADGVDCAQQRRSLERCTERQSSLLLHTSLLPRDREDSTL